MVKDTFEDDEFIYITGENVPKKKLVLKNIQVRDDVTELEVPIPIGGDYPSMYESYAEQAIWEAIDYDVEVIDTSKE